MSILKTIGSKQITIKTATIAGTVLAVTSIFCGTVLQKEVFPKINAEYVRITEALNPPTTYAREIDAEGDTKVQRVDAYFDEEYQKLEEEYEQAQKDKARLNAMERVEAEFEAEKQEIRERELLI